MDIIEVLSIVVNSVCTKHILQDLESIEIIIFSRGSIVENTNVRVNHLVITDHENRRSVVRLLRILCCNISRFGHAGEGLLNSIDNLFMINLTSSNYYGVITVVIGRHKVSEVIKLDFLS